MKLSKNSIAKINSLGIEIPNANYFNLPEKVLQFGTGVLLRGLPDYFIDKANKKKIFNGRIVIVKSTDGGDAGAFEKQDGLYTLCVRGIEEGKIVEENIISASISRVLSAKNDWDEILKCATNDEIQIIISNTTEVGLVLMNDNIYESPPVSFPGKLLSFLYKRYKTFHGDETKGMVIIPTELVVDNGKKLFSILMELSQQNDLENDFIKWMQNANHFCSSLVDRIVPGKLNAPEQNIIQTKFGYEDELMIMSEAYKLWAIESSDKKVKEVLSFADADSGIIVAPDIAFFRELKLRLLNGSHTFSCGLAFLAGFATVKDAMNNESFSAFIKKLMLEEIAPAIETENISLKEANDFALKVLDRYRNPFIEHQWLSITLQYSSKMQMRNLPTLKNYVDRFKKIPLKMALGFAGYILFMRPVEFIDNKYYGEINGRQYFINDDKASYFYEIWKSGNINFVVNAVAENKMLWNEDLSLTEGFSEAVKNYLHLLIDFGAKKTIDQLI